MPLPRLFRLTVAVLVIVLCALTSLAASPATASSPTLGSWQWPLTPPPPLVRPFDPPDAPWLPGHRGIDLGAEPGQPVLAVADGRVTYAGEVAGVGVVVVDHGVIRSTYQPVVARIEVGQRVAPGTVLGTVTVVGSHCLPESCLHLGARRGADYLDPLRLLSPLPVRLKPTMSGQRASPSSDRRRPLGPAVSSLGLGLGAGVSLAVGGP